MFDNIISIPLLIESEDKTPIKETFLSLGIDSFKDKGRRITGVLPEGTYSIELTDFKSIKSYSTDTDKEWNQKIQQLLPLHNDSIYEELVLSAKFINDPQYYEDGELIDEYETINNFITIEVRTPGKLSRVLGEFKLEEIEVATNLFEWIKQLVDTKTEILKKYNDMKGEFESVAKERQAYKKGLDDNIKNHKLILEDLEAKFSKILYSKKRRIVELLPKTDKISNLNEVFEENDKNNLKKIKIDKEKLPDNLDDVYTSPKKRKAKASKASPKKKAKKVKKEVSDEELTDEEPQKDTKVKKEFDEEETSDEDYKVKDGEFVDEILGKKEEEEEEEGTEYSDESEDEEVEAVENDDDDDDDDDDIEEEDDEGDDDDMEEEDDDVVNDNGNDNEKQKTKDPGTKIKQENPEKLQTPDKHEKPDKHENPDNDEIENSQSTIYSDSE